ncbi:class I SAM-dependent methyltransferase [Sphingomonas sp. PAMC 26621]|uniref:class I SAM-dependent methyltransferase n=1 Tax=Sphingomonas sp. PAMC 26621 TaxID=1112213 RepID=UPI00028911D4|nr:class I SAM-dependent methyltransferase [Sphingomonas sp. PAMC 26621]
MTLDTGWTRAIASGFTPDAAAVRDHLETVHRVHAGFTESCAARCVDAEGRDSYDWLADVIDYDATASILDLACGSGVLLERLAGRNADVRLTGVDMSADELALARRRLGPDRVALHHGLAQDLGFLADGSIDGVLCHWALTLMDPVAPVLAEVARVLKPRGVFAAIVDGPMDIAPGYSAVNDLISNHVRRAYPRYGDVDLGDARIRDTTELHHLLCDVFPGAHVRIESNVVSATAAPEALAREASSFFYSAFLLTEGARTNLLIDLAALFSEQGAFASFHMPINRVLVAR